MARGAPKKPESTRNLQKSSFNNHRVDDVWAGFSVGLQVIFKKNLLWALKYIIMTYFGLFGAPWFELVQVVHVSFQVRSVTRRSAGLCSFH